MKYTDSLLWGIIESLDWGTRSRTEHHAYNFIKMEFMTMYNEETSKAVENFIDERYRELSAAYNKYRRDTNDSAGFFGGDDSFSDMMHHVIGLGREAFEGVMEDMTMLNYVHYVESFSYCIPHLWGDGPTDYAMLDREYHKDNARKALARLAERVTDKDLVIDDLEARGIAELFHRLTLMIAGDFDTAIGDFDFQSDYRSMSNIDTYSANIISDAKTALDYMK